MKVIDMSLVTETKEAVRAGKYSRPDEWIRTVTPNDLLAVLDSCCTFIFGNRGDKGREDACALGLGLAAAWQPLRWLGGQHVVEAQSVVNSVEILAIVCCYEHLRRLGWVEYIASSLLLWEAPLHMVPLRSANQIVDEISQLNHNMAKCLDGPIHALSLIHAMEILDRKEREQNAERPEAEEGPDSQPTEDEVPDPETP